MLRWALRSRRSLGFTAVLLSLCLAVDPHLLNAALLAWSGTQAAEESNTGLLDQIGDTFTFLSTFHQALQGDVPSYSQEHVEEAESNPYYMEIADFDAIAAGIQQMTQDGYGALADTGLPLTSGPVLRRMPCQKTQVTALSGSGGTVVVEELPSIQMTEDVSSSIPVSCSPHSAIFIFSHRDFELRSAGDSRLECTEIPEQCDDWGNCEPGCTFDCGTGPLKDQPCYVTYYFADQYCHEGPGNCYCTHACQFVGPDSVPLPAPGTDYEPHHYCPQDLEPHFPQHNGARTIGLVKDLRGGVDIDIPDIPLVQTYGGSCPLTGRLHTVVVPATDTAQIRIYFVMDRSDGHGSVDLYRYDSENGTIQHVLHLDPTDDNIRIPYEFDMISPWKEGDVIWLVHGGLLCGDDDAPRQITFPFYVFPGSVERSLVCPLGNYPCVEDPEHPGQYFCEGAVEAGVFVLPSDDVTLGGTTQEQVDVIAEQNCRQQEICVERDSEGQCIKTVMHTICDHCTDGLSESVCWDDQENSYAHEFGSTMGVLALAAQMGFDKGGGIRVFPGFFEWCVYKGGFIFQIDCCEELGSGADDLRDLLNKLKLGWQIFKYGRGIYQALTAPVWIAGSGGTVMHISSAGAAAAGTVNTMSAIQVAQQTGNYSVIFKAIGNAFFDSIQQMFSFSTLFSPSMLISIAISVVIYFLIQWLTYTCRSKEAGAAIKSRLGVCHYNGTFCKEETLFGCKAKARSYCCFRNKLARIIHEQGRPQIGRGWGDSESPDCRGFTLEELAQLDFSVMDFSEIVEDILRGMQDKFETDEQYQLFQWEVEETINERVEWYVGQSIQQRLRGAMFGPQ